MLAKILKGNRNFIPVMIFILSGMGFLLMNLTDIKGFERIASSILFLAAMVQAALTVNSFPYFRGNFYFTFLIAIHFILLFCCAENLNFYAGFFLLSVVVTQLLFTYQKETYMLNGFDLGFFMAAAIIFYPPFWIFAIFLIISFIIKGKTEVRSLIITIIGLLAMALLAFEIMAVWDLWYLWDWFTAGLNFNFFEAKLSHLFLIPLLIPPALGLADYYRNINRQSANKKMVFFDALLYAIFSIIFLVFYGGSLPYALLIPLLPMVLLTANFLTYSQTSWHKDAILWGTLVFLLLFRFHQHIDLPELFDQVTF